MDKNMTAAVLTSFGGPEVLEVRDDARAHNVTSSSLSDEQLACLPTAYGTAMGMLERADIVEGDTILVTGASGGVEFALVQLASIRGARVIAMTTSAKGDLVAEARADVIVDRILPSEI